MAQAHGEHPWGKQGTEGMARSGSHCSCSGGCGGRGVGVREGGGGDHGGKRSWTEAWGRGENNSNNSQYLLNS